MARRSRSINGAVNTTSLILVSVPPWGAYRGQYNTKDRRHNAASSKTKLICATRLLRESRLPRTRHRVLTDTSSFYNVTAPQAIDVVRTLLVLESDKRVIERICVIDIASTYRRLSQWELPNGDVDTVLVGETSKGIQLILQTTRSKKYIIFKDGML